MAKDFLTQVRDLLYCQRVQATVVRLFRALDERDWEAVRDCLADEIDTDYRSFRGTPPARMTAEEFVRLREIGLAGLKTQHLGMNHAVEIVGHAADTATCRCDFVVHRWPLDESDRRFFHTYGFYHFVLNRKGESWKIAGITQVALRSEGHPEIHGAFAPPGSESRTESGGR
jgi:3-phenylpropionate/cinnamic acid dioxygenase small subunit